MKDKIKLAEISVSIEEKSEGGFKLYTSCELSDFIDVEPTLQEVVIKSVEKLLGGLKDRFQKED